MLRSRFTGSVALAVVAAVPTGVLGGPTPSHAGVPSRAGTIAFLRQEAGNPTGLFAVQADGSGLRRLVPSGLDVASFEWSPDGSRIAYLDSRGALRLVRPDGAGRELLRASSPQRSPWFLSWSPDGKAIAMDARDPAAEPLTAQTNGLHLRIFVLQSDGGAPRRLPSGDAQDLDWSPHGAEIAYGDGSGRQRIIRTDGSKARPFFARPQKRGFGIPTWSPDGTHVGFVGGVGAGGTSTGIPRSMSPTQTEATFTSSRAMRTTNSVSPGPRRAEHSLRQGEPRRHLRHRRRRTEQPQADARLASPRRLRSPDLGTRRALHCLRHGQNR